MKAKDAGGKGFLTRVLGVEESLWEERRRGLEGDAELETMGVEARHPQAQ